MKETLKEIANVSAKGIATAAQIAVYPTMPIALDDGQKINVLTAELNGASATRQNQIEDNIDYYLKSLSGLTILAWSRLITEFCVLGLATGVAVLSLPHETQDYLSLAFLGLMTYLAIDTGLTSLYTLGKHAQTGRLGF